MGLKIQNGVPFQKLCDMFQKLQSEQSQLAKIEIFSEYFNRNIAKKMLFLLDLGGPNVKNLKISDKICEKIISDKVMWNHIIQDYDVYAKKYPNISEHSLFSAGDIITIMKKICRMSGTGSNKLKTDLILQTLKKFNRGQIYWFISILRSKLRIGFSHNSIIIAINKMGYGKSLDFCKKVWGASTGLEDFWLRINSENPMKIQYHV